MTLTLRYGKFNKKTCTKLHQSRPRFVKDMTKHFGVFFQFKDLTAFHLQNVNAKFHKVA